MKFAPNSFRQKKFIPKLRRKICPKITAKIRPKSSFRQKNSSQNYGKKIYSFRFLSRRGHGSIWTRVNLDTGQSGHGSIWTRVNLDTGQTSILKLGSPRQSRSVAWHRFALAFEQVTGPCSNYFQGMSKSWFQFHWFYVTQPSRWGLGITWNPVCSSYI